MKELIYYWCGLRYVKCHECETLKLLLEQEKSLSKRLLEQLLKEPEAPVEEPVKYEPIKPVMNLAQMKAYLEQKDKIAAMNAANRQRTEELEKEMKLHEA